jgi:hypothetical protein
MRFVDYGPKPLTTNSFVGDYSDAIRMEGYCACFELYGRCSMLQFDYPQTCADFSAPAVNDAPRHGGFYAPRPYRVGHPR